MAKEKTVLSAKIEPQYVKALDKVAKAQGITRSQLLREFAENAELLYEFLKVEKGKQKDEALQLIDALTKKLLEKMPEDVYPEWLDILSQALTEVAQMKRKGQV